MLTIVAVGYKTRLLAIALGLSIFLWLSLEDNDVTAVTILGWLASLLILSSWIMSRFSGMQLSGKRFLAFTAGLGATIGASANLIVALLMLFKDVRHAHVFPDYPPQMILAMLERLPVWTIGTACILLGLGLLYKILKSDHTGAS